MSAEVVKKKEAEANVKLEGQDGETITDIQNYLETFNKEIQDGTQVNAQAATEGGFFIDQSGNSHYFYTSANGEQQQVMTVVAADGEDGQGESIAISIPASIEEGGEANSGEATYITMPRADGQDGTIAMETTEDVILNAGDGYQTVTIVPSETGSGEVSYVLIVQQPEDGKDKDSEDADLSNVYDFDEGEEGAPAESGEDEDKTKIIKIVPKKSQTVTQAHMCNYCNYTSPKRYLLSRHMKSHSEERPHKCSVCERGFKTLASLQNHVNTHTGTKPHRCKFCDSAFTTSGELVRHVRYKHTHEKPHHCTECDYSSVELSKLKRHMRCHTGERPYQCPHCTYASPDTFKLKRHLRIHTGEKPYECDVCHARFTQSNSLKAHRLIHTAGDKPVFQCELCPTTCGRKTDLRIHVQKLHTSDKPLKCKRCGKSYPDRYTFKVHNKTHEGEKCFKCDLCPYASISQRHLESHMLIHTDQKPYQCDQCDQAFRQKQLLKRHQNLYHNPNYVPPTPKEKTHECPECGRAFRHKGNLIRHMAVHDPESSAQEKALALKLGRQKKIQIIDGQQVEVMPTESDEEEEDEDEEDEDGDVMAVEGQDGQQYVVLEVIQLQDGSDAMAVVDENIVVSGPEATETLTTSIEGTSDGSAGEPRIIQTLKTRKLTKRDAQAIKKKLETQKDMENCFGFDDDDEDEEEESTGDLESKESLKLLETINE
ncbi:transcriptional repressor CTCFL-like [Neocloeon triangulifer]|uniref:transcriptional repressor CTCFL-like n=1 Tax=Neocloeon triangulifer TaxID=2078957 RepID=UPI00286F5B7A|nr:transcriptional repressor CTCFL-like [Neocloeon triangulifer]XP_059477047.1 transcriptional repressor CTCFL-like [Neocloeon triangulifer]XP_059477048.1 transcriptional repressor CTCFL-like [Neocloeon triangulifer]